MVGIERLNAMRMAARDRVGAVIDQPARQFSLTLAHSCDVLLAPMHENQNERGLSPPFRDRGCDTISIEIAVRIVKCDHSRIRPRWCFENRRFVRANDRNVVRLQASGRVQ